jgi:type IV secretion system protein VirB9
MIPHVIPRMIPHSIPQTKLIRRVALGTAIGVVLAVTCAAASLGAQTTPADTQPTARPDTGDAIVAATRDYQTTGVARTVVQGDFLTFPFGHGQPTLTCTVLRACVIELQAGEVVLSRIAGDTERWEILPAAAGADGRTVLIVVKPRDCDITTNVVLATDHRLYDLTLDSPPCKARSTNPQHAYARHVRFYYPDETVAAWSKPAVPAEPGPVRIAPDIAQLNFGSAVKTDRKFPWVPAQVFDDGARVYIKLPEAAKQSEAPVLFLLDADGGKTLLNYALVGGDTYVTDRLFDRAALVAGIDGQERKVVIERTGGGR